MEYKQIDKLLNRELAITESLEVIEKYSPYLQELINYAVALLARCSQSAKGTGGTPFSPLSIYRHAIQMTDGIEVLLSQAALTPAIPLIRSIFEAKLSLEYMFRENYEERSAAWLVCSRLEQIRFLKSIDPTSQNESDFKLGMESSEHADFVRACLDEVNIKTESDMWEQSIDKPKFKLVVDFFKNSQNRVPWYRISDGPKNFRCLAKKLGRLLEYVTLFKHWSTTAHAQNDENIVGRHSAGGYIKPIRSTAEDIQRMYIEAGTFLILISCLMAKKFRSSEKALEDQRKIIQRHRPKEFANKTTM